MSSFGPDDGIADLEPASDRFERRDDVLVRLDPSDQARAGALIGARGLEQGKIGLPIQACCDANITEPPGYRLAGCRDNGFKRQDMAAAAAAVGLDPYGVAVNKRLPIRPAERRVGLLDPRGAEWRLWLREVGNMAVIVRRTRHDVAERVQFSVSERNRTALQTRRDQWSGDRLVQRDPGLQHQAQLVDIASKAVNPAWMHRAWLSQPSNRLHEGSCQLIA
jgi:hypothetical protein